MLKWRDTRDVMMISSEYAATLTQTHNRFEQAKIKPASVIHYNANMKGIDQSDQMQSYYSALRRHYSWAKKVTVHMIEIMMYNAFILYGIARKNSGRINQYDTFLRFRKSVACEFTRTPEGPRRLQAILPQREPVRNRPVVVREHDPVKIGRSRGRPLQRQCVVCKAKDIVKKSVYQCLQCDTKPALCYRRCFSKYHFAKLHNIDLQDIVDEEDLLAEATEAGQADPADELHDDLEPEEFGQEFVGEFVIESNQLPEDQEDMFAD